MRMDMSLLIHAYGYVIATTPFPTPFPTTLPTTPHLTPFPATLPSTPHPTPFPTTLPTTTLLTPFPTTLPTTTPYPTPLPKHSQGRRSDSYVYRKKKSELNGVEGVLGAKGSDTRWQFIFGTRSISVKADNFETVTRSKNTMHDEFMRASIQFEYNNEVVNAYVFDQIWKHANKDGGIEGLFDTIVADEHQFDNIYQAFVQH